MSKLYATHRNEFMLLFTVGFKLFEIGFPFNLSSTYVSVVLELFILDLNKGNILLFMLLF